MQTDAQIIEEAERTPEAFATVVRRHHDAIWRYVARRLGPDTADDLTSDVFTTAFAARTRFDSARDSARPWLFGIATNLIRRHARHEAQILDAYARTGRPPHVDAPANDGAGPALAAALAKMRKPHRDALLLHALADMTYEEIAQAMDVPIGTVRGWIHRARAVAARELAAQGVLPHPPRDADAKVAEK